MALIKHVSKVGNGYALRLNKTILDVMNITEDTPLKIEISTTNGYQLIITPVTEDSGDFDRALEQAYSELKPVLPRMPDRKGKGQRKTQKE